MSYQEGVPVFGYSSRLVVVVRVVVVVDDVVDDVDPVVDVVDVDPVVDVVDDDPVVDVVDDVDPVVDVVDDVDPGDVVDVVDDVVVTVAQIPFVMVLVSSVTAPLRANNCPCTVAPVFAVMDVKAKMCPTKWELVPSVAELPTFQKIRQYRAPLMRLTLLFDAVTSVEAVLNMKTALGSPWALSVRVPVI